jgi:hypothetical protein
VLIHCQTLSDNEFCLEVCEAGVIETEVALQRAIGDTAAVAEQCNDLIDDLVKIHSSPPHASPRRSYRGTVTKYTEKRVQYLLPLVGTQGYHGEVMEASTRHERQQGWPGTSIPLLTALIPDVILGSPASWSETW